MRHRHVAGFVVTALLLGLTPAWAQVSTGSIAGVVRDTSGAVLPGVTVEAASPALIEKVRSVVSDAQGNYKIIELRTGTYRHLHAARVRHRPSRGRGAHVRLHGCRERGPQGRSA